MNLADPRSTIQSEALWGGDAVRSEWASGRDSMVRSHGWA